ncbi:MAG: helix-turn-helix domain-containing protein, partial [Ktedonobacterales bacterium]
MAGDYLPSFGALLRRYRRGLGITQQKLAAKAGYSEVYVGMLERGERLPSGATLEAFADALALAGHQRDALVAAARAPGRGMGRAAATAIAAPAPASSLVGRIEELALLRRHLEGDGPVLLALAGEPGIGKTRLLQEVVQRAPADGWKVLVGGSHLQSGQEPFTPVLGALERY